MSSRRSFGELLDPRLGLEQLVQSPAVVGASPGQLAKRLRTSPRSRVASMARAGMGVWACSPIR
jgi:hypothetical protein